MKRDLDERRKKVETRARTAEEQGEGGGTRNCIQGAKLLSVVHFGSNFDAKMSKWCVRNILSWKV